jgi:hypothetical protein
MIQGEYRYHLTVEQRKQGWQSAVILLRQAFPHQAHGSTMFNYWPKCETLIEHVVSTAERFRELNVEIKIDYWEDFVYLIADGAK